MTHQNSTDSAYIMHTKVKDFIDIHFRRFDEINIKINQNSVSTFAELVFIGHLINFVGN